MLVFGIYNLDIHFMSLGAVCVVWPAPCFQLGQSALAFLSNTGVWSGTLISAWRESSSENGSLSIFSQQLNLVEWAFQKALNTVALLKVKILCLHVASSWLLFFWVKSKNILFPQYLWSLSRTCHSSVESLDTLWCRYLMSVSPIQK